MRISRTLGLTLALLAVGWTAAYAVARAWPAPQAKAPGAAAGSQAAPLGAPARASGVSAAVASAEVAIADVAEALTLARFARPEGPPGVMRVLSMDQGHVNGIDITAALPAGADPITAYQALGLERLGTLPGTPLRLAYGALLLPFDGAAVQVAAGINYPEHGRESQVDQSFLFPKPVRATGPLAPVAAGAGLLDYELELGFVVLEPLARGRTPATMGLVLAADYTDRALLLRRLNVRNVASGEGFALGKGFAGSMPLGALLVIPRDLERFVRELKLELWLDGQRRQVAEPKDMTWGIGRLLAETFALEGRRWAGPAGEVGLPVSAGVLAERTVILSGTPGGTLFQGLGARHRFLGVTELVAGVHGWQLNAVTEPYIRDALAAGSFLQPGQEVVMRADKLGLIVNRVQPREP